MGRSCVTNGASRWAAPDAIHSLFASAIAPPMQVTQEDGGRLNAFAREPRMVVMEQGEASTTSSRLLLIGGAVLVTVLVLLAARIS